MLRTASRRALRSASSAVVLLGWAGAAAAQPQAAVAIRHVTVIPLTGARLLERQTVVVQGGHIAALGPDSALPVPTGSGVIDGTGKYLIPGLIEMHGHTSKTRASALGLYVVHGVTTLRDMGSEHAEVLRWRREIRAGTRVGPRMLIAGPYLESRSNIERMRRDPPEARVEPFERARIGVGSPEEARRVIDSLAALELDFFKVRTVQDRETYFALCRAAHAHGKRLVGHVVTRSPATLLECGQDGIEHGFSPAVDSLTREERMGYWRELARRDVGVVPTLVTIVRSGFPTQSYFRALLADTMGAIHPLRPYVARFTVLDWREQADEATEERRALLKQYWSSAVRNVKEMREVGVRIMAGSDVAVLNIFPGASLHDELELLVDSVGMTPLEALASATRRSAEWLGLGDSVGTVEVGKVADLVLLEADPLADIRNTRRVAAVVLRGTVYDRAGLQAILASVKAAPDQRVNDWVR